MHRSSRPDGFLDELAAQHPDRLSGTHKDILRDSGLDWTVVRPPRLTDKPLTGTYRTAYGQNLRRGFFVARADVAQLMLRVLEQPDTIKQAIGIAN